jgi:membrane-associated protease RseP (regulator of RpoE activity)
MDGIRSHRCNHHWFFMAMLPFMALFLAIGARSAAAAGWLGISVQDLSREIAEAMNLRVEGGALVSDVVAGGPAEGAGLRVRDVITQIDSEMVAKANDLVSYLNGKDPGSRVTLRVMRDGDQRTIEIGLGVAPKSSEQPNLKGERPGNDQQRMERERNKRSERPLSVPGSGGGRLGVRVYPLDRDLAPYFQTEPGRGLLVISIVPGSPGSAAGIRSGDVILKLGDSDIYDVGQLRDKVRSLKEGDEFSIELLRKGRVTRIHGTMTGNMAATPPEMSRPRASLTPGSGWDQRREMIWGHSQLQRLEREMQELQRKIEDLSQRLERFRQDRMR